MKSKDVLKYFGQALVDMQKDIVEDLNMREIVEDIPFEYISSGICLSKD